MSTTKEGWPASVFTTSSCFLYGQKDKHIETRDLICCAKNLVWKPELQPEKVHGGYVHYRKKTEAPQRTTRNTQRNGKCSRWDISKHRPERVSRRVFGGQTSTSSTFCFAKCVSRGTKMKVTDVQRAGQRYQEGSIDASERIDAPTTKTKSGHCLRSRLRTMNYNLHRLLALETRSRTVSSQESWIARGTSQPRAEAPCLRTEVLPMSMSMSKNTAIISFREGKVSRLLGYAPLQSTSVLGCRCGNAGRKLQPVCMWID